MSTQNHENPKKADAAEPVDIEKRIAELHKQGILVGGEGERGSLLRFLDQLYGRHRKPDRE